MTWLEWLGLASTLRMVAVVVVARLSDSCGGGGSARTIRAQREVQLALRNNYYIRRAPQILFIEMARALSRAGGNTRSLMRDCNSEVRHIKIECTSI